MKMYMVKGKPNISAKNAIVNAKYILLGRRAIFLLNCRVTMKRLKKITLIATRSHWFQPNDVRVR